MPLDTYMVSSGADLELTQNFLRYRISANNFRGNLLSQYLDTGAETIQGGNYSRAETIHGYMVCEFYSDFLRLGDFFL